MPLTNNQIVNAVRESVAEALADVGTLGLRPTDGTANFDCALIRLDHPRPTLARALCDAGFKMEWCSYRLQGRGYPLHYGDAMPNIGSAQLWTAFCERLAQKLEERGVPASVRYMMD